MPLETIVPKAAEIEAAAQEANAVIGTLYPRVDALKTDCDMLVVENPDERKQAEQLIINANKLRKEIEASPIGKFKKLMYDAYQQGSQNMSALLADLREVASTANAKITTYDLCEIAKETARRKSAEDMPPPATVPPPVKSEGVAQRTTREVKILDAAIIPAAYLMPDIDKLRKFAGATDGAVKVPGVEFIKRVTRYSTGRGE